MTDANNGRKDFGYQPLKEGYQPLKEGYQPINKGYQPEKSELAIPKPQKVNPIVKYPIKEK